MNITLSILRSIRLYMKQCDWVLMHELNDRSEIWRRDASSEEIMLPVDGMVDNRQAEPLVMEALAVLAKNSKESIPDLYSRIADINCDLLSMRAYGGTVGKGTINLSKGVSALGGFYRIVTLSVNKAITVKGKRKICRDYLDGLDLLAPAEGSFIYTIKTDLSLMGDSNNLVEKDSSGSVGRAVNMHIYNSINMLHKNSRSEREFNNLDLIKDGLDGNMCRSFLDAFPEDLEGLDFIFDWSILDDMRPIQGDRISFDRNGRAKISLFQNTLSKEFQKDVADLPVHVEMYKRKKGEKEGRVSFRLPFGNNSYACSVNVSAEIYEKLRQIGNDEEVLISARLHISSATRTVVKIEKLKSVKLGSKNEMFLFDDKGRI